MKKRNFHVIYTIALLFVAVLIVTSCKSSRGVAGSKPSVAESHQMLTSRCLSARVELTVPTRDAVLTVNGNMKLLRDERIQISLLMPILRTEVARIDFTPDELLLVDRMGKRYCRVRRESLGEQLSESVDFSRLEQFIRQQAVRGEFTLTANQFGLTGLDRAKLRLSNFSGEDFSMSPTELNSRYTEVTIGEILRLLQGLQQK